MLPLVDAYLDEGTIDEETYQAQRARLENDKRDLKERLDANHLAEFDVEQVLSFAGRLFADLTRCWNRLDWKQKPGFQSVLLPDGLVLNDYELGTNQTSWLFDVFGVADSENERVAAPSSLSWNRIEEWLVGIDRLRRSLLARSQNRSI